MSKKSPLKLSSRVKLVRVLLIVQLERLSILRSYVYNIYRTSVILHFQPNSPYDVAHRSECNTCGRESNRILTKFSTTLFGLKMRNIDSHFSMLGSNYEILPKSVVFDEKWWPWCVRSPDVPFRRNDIEKHRKSFYKRFETVW